MFVVIVVVVVLSVEDEPSMLACSQIASLVVENLKWMFLCQTTFCLFRDLCCRVIVSTHYASQSTYNGGNVMCMCACLHWLVAILTLKYTPIMPNAVMDRLMRAAAKAHATACRSAGFNSPSNMLNSEELVEYVGLPEGMKSYTLAGHVMDSVDSDFGNTVHLDDVDTHLTGDCCGMVVTGRRHSVALVRYAGELYIFDPLPASVTGMEMTKPNVRHGLKNALGCISEFDCLVLKQDKSHKRYTK